MFISDTVRVFSGWGKWELPLMIFFGMTCVAYMVTRLSLFEAVLGNAQFFDFSSTFALSNMSPILFAYFAKQGPTKQKRRYKFAIMAFLIISIVFDLLFTANLEMRSMIKEASLVILTLIVAIAAGILIYRGTKEKNRIKYIEAGAYCILAAGFVLNAVEIFDEKTEHDFANPQMLCITAFFVIITVTVVVSLISEYRERSKKAEREAIAANEAKSTFLSSMSHEIRTPINAVLGMNEMILRECEDEKIIGYSESIRTAGSTLLGLVNDILDFSKIEAGKLDIITVDYDLSSVLNDLVNMIHIKAEAKGLELKMDIDPEIPKLLHGDDIRLKQIITNILTNAVKYTEKGSVTLTMGFDRIPDDENAVMLKVSVADTGIGIKKEDMSKLYGEFERIEELRNRSVEGTGLGMSITRRLLGLMDSSLSVESEYGKGSVFSFAVRQTVVKWELLGDYEEAFKKSLTERKRYKEHFTAPDARVLVIDDNPMNLSVFKNLLKQTKVRVDAAGSGDEGIVLADINLYDIIFIDHMMPDKDGIETLVEIRAGIALNEHTPAVCLTANAVSGAREMYLEAGFDDYLTKPIDPSRLERMIMGYLPEEKVIVMESTDTDEISEASEEEMIEQLPDWIKNIPEIDVKAGIGHCKNIDSYLDAVKIYESLVNTNADEIERYIEAQDTENATIKIHALKSTSRVIGAEDLGSLAEKLEMAGKANDTDTLYSKAGELLKRYRQLGSDLKPIAADDAPEGSELTPIDEEMLGEMFTAIREFMSVSDYDSAVELIEGLKGYSVPETEKERCRQLIAAAAEIRYEDIEQLLR
ncbi:MAG: response regulator [Lachnospiraceae bacterium]|nr:response regulator [Lachnospiraceae bacterium]